MDHNKLTKYEALKLITPVADEEATPEERRAFFAFIENNAEVREKYQSERNIKKLMRTRCPCSSAPPSLYRTVKQILRDHQKWS